MRRLNLNAAAVCALILLLGAIHSASGGAVSFSVNGWVDPGLDGLADPIPSIPIFLPPWQPGPTPLGTGPWPHMRWQTTGPGGPPLKAVGIPTMQPGDVHDYFIPGYPSWINSEAEIFQSEPGASAGGASNAPSGTNNQILKAVALGLRPGDTGGTTTFNASNINAYTFGEDFFNGNEAPQGGGTVFDDLWHDRQNKPAFTEPVVGGPNWYMKFYFSVDPWAIGAAATDVRKQATNNGALTLPVGPAGAADVDTMPPPYGLGPWLSDGEAAGDVFSTEPIISSGMNKLVYDEVSLGLQAPRPVIMPPQPPIDAEDDLDALEVVGTNIDRSAGIPGNPREAGNTHDRVTPTSGANSGSHPPDLGNPTNANHDPVNTNPIIFSVDRNSYGTAGSAVEAQVNHQFEGACADLFIAVTISPAGTPVTTNMLLVDEGQLGLVPHDDLDAVALKLLISHTNLLQRIQTATANFNAGTGSTGLGFTIPLLNPGEAAVAFSVDTSSIGLRGTAVDFECRVDALGLAGATPAASGVMEQAGDIFYTDLLPPAGQSLSDPVTGLLYCQNYLWFEETAIGLDRGSWSFTSGHPSGNLGDLPDDLNALDTSQRSANFTATAIVSIPDYCVLCASWGWSGPADCSVAADLNCDGSVTFTDVDLFMSQWLQTPP